MGFLHRLFGVAPPAPRAQSFALNDPAFLEIIRSGRSSRAALEVSAVYRCVSLISQAMGMLPLRMMKREAAGVLAEEAFDHPLTKVLGAEPNAAQSAYVFKRLMQLRMLTKGNAYARIVRTGSRVVALVPIDPDRVEPRQNDDGSIVYRVSGAGGTNEIAPRDMLHLFDASLDGIKGISVVELATDAIGLSAAAAQSLRRIYQNGFSSSGAFTHPNKLSKEAKASLREQIETGFSGSENGGRMVMLDEGMDVKLFSTSARDAQTLETARHQIEDIARFFGVPRPLMGLDDTSWGSGVEQLGILFVRYALSPYFVCWEQALARALLTEAEKPRYALDFDDQELLRGSMKDQAEFFARALGSGGSRPWAEPNEVRDRLGMPRHKDGYGLQPAQMQSGKANVDPPPTAN